MLPNFLACIVGYQFVEGVDANKLYKISILQQKIWRHVLKGPHSVYPKSPVLANSTHSADVSSANAH